MAGTHRFTERLTLLGTILLALTGCGGGGSSGAASSNPSSPAAGNNEPVAAFSVTPGEGSAPLVVTVDASASTDPDGDRLFYLWDFGTATQDYPAVGQVARYTYTEPGSYSISLQISDGAGGSDTATKTVQVIRAGSASLSGTIRILASTAIDRDVNDRLATPQANDSFASAQPIGNPAVVGGFANVPGSGEELGNLTGTGDPGDFYQVTLSGSERIELDIADPGADLHLRLWDSAQRLVDLAVGTGGTESLTVTAPGTYFIEVWPETGASNYVLTVGQDPGAAQSADGFRLGDPFVPGEVVVKTDDPDLARRHRMTLRKRADRFGLLSLDSRSATGATGRRPTPALPAGGSATPEQLRRYRTLLAVRQLAADPAVEIAEPNLLRHALRLPDDPLFKYQWHYESINLPLAWDVTTGGDDPNSPVVVAVVDTGILGAHPDLRGQLTGGYDFIADPSRARDGDGIDADPEDDGDLAFGASSSFHGTHVAGTIGARTNNATGVAGVIWDVQIMPLRVLGVDGGTSYDVAQAIRYAAGLRNDAGRLPPRRADVINLSVGSSLSSQVEQDAVADARAAGVILVASAGNEGNDLPIYPASYDGVIGVSATTISRAAASYSNFGTTIDVAAPGGDSGTDLNADGIGDGIVSTLGDDSSGDSSTFIYSVLNGTSMAAPHVSGVIALMKSVYPGMTPRELDLALMAGDMTDDLGAPGRDDRYGYGLINAQRAVLAALRLATGQGSDPGPILTASAGTLNFGAFVDTLPLNLQNAGTGDLTVLEVVSNEPWISARAGSTDAAGLGTYQVVVDRSGLADGLYTARLSATSDANDIEVQIRMQVSSLDLSADAGLHYVILVDAEGKTALPAVLVTAEKGSYAYRIAEVPAGQYRIFAGTDSDDDGFLCDAGEACGAYPTLDLPERISVNEDRSGLDFLSAFRVELTGTSATDLGPEPGGIRFRSRESVQQEEGDTP